MTVTLHLSPQLEASVRRQAVQSGMDIEAFLIEAVKAKVATSDKDVDQKREMTPDEIDEFLEEVAQLNPAVTTFVDDSRESIYD